MARVGPQRHRKQKVRKNVQICKIWLFSGPHLQLEANIFFKTNLSENEPAISNNRK
jgi:hypothetical protein